MKKELMKIIKLVTTFMEKLFKKKGFNVVIFLNFINIILM